MEQDTAFSLVIGSIASSQKQCSHRDLKKAAPGCEIMVICLLFLIESRRQRHKQTS